MSHILYSICYTSFVLKSTKLNLIFIDWVLTTNKLDLWFVTTVSSLWVHGLNYVSSWDLKGLQSSIRVNCFTTGATFNPLCNQPAVIITGVDAPSASACWLQLLFKGANSNSVFISFNYLLILKLLLISVFTYPGHVS